MDLFWAGSVPNDFNNSKQYLYVTDWATVIDWSIDRLHCIALLEYLYVTEWANNDGDNWWQFTVDNVWRCWCSSVSCRRRSITAQ